MNDTLKQAVCHIYFRETSWKKANAVCEAPSTYYSLVWETVINHSFDCSLGQEVEANSSKFRDRFYSKVEQIGKSEIKGKLLSEYFRLSTNQSFWPISDFCEMNNMIKMPEFETAIKVMALIELLQTHDTIKRVCLFDFPTDLEAQIRKCLPKNIEFSGDVNNFSIAKGLRKLGSLFFLISDFITRSISDVYVSLAARTERMDTHLWDSKDLVCDYASPILIDQTGRPYFQSKYWGRVSDLFVRSERETFFLHIYNRSDGVSGPRKYVKNVAALNQAESKNNHIVLQSLGSPALLISTFIDSARVLIKYIINRRLICEAMGEVAPVLLPCADRAFCGGAVFHNIYLHNLFAAFVGRVINLERIFVISECQSWEISLVKLLRNAKKDHEIFLVPHVPSKFWDLRSWYFPRIEHDIKICVSSGAAYKAYQGAGIDARRLIRIEAMRFNRESGGAVEQSKQLPPSAERSIKIAYFADYSSKVTSSHILLLIEALKKVKVNFELLIKNHPDSEADFSCLEFCKPRLVNEDAYAIIKDSNIVVAGARSSISVQGWEMGAYLLLIYDRTRLNSSAMRELDSITFCGDHNELTAGILQYSDVESPVDPFRNFFITDPALRRWRNLIGALDDRNMEIL